MFDSFAFVEYEDRRDADDAYHDMHNKRIGRDDILKIEVSSAQIFPSTRLPLANDHTSGLAPLRLLRGASTAAIGTVARAARLLAVARLARVDAVTTRLARMIVATGTVVTGTTTATAVTPVTALAALTGKPSSLSCMIFEAYLRLPLQ